MKENSFMMNSYSKWKNSSSFIHENETAPNAPIVFFPLNYCVLRSCRLRLFTDFRQGIWRRKGKIRDEKGKDSWIVSFQTSKKKFSKIMWMFRWQLMRYTAPSVSISLKNFRVDFVGKFSETSIRSGRKSRIFNDNELKVILKLGAAIKN